MLGCANMILNHAYLDVLYRVRAAPLTHLGAPSLLLLEAFHDGYSRFSLGRGKEAYSFYPHFRDWIIKRYGVHGGTLGIGQILRRIAESDEVAFALFFQELDVALAVESSGLCRREPFTWEGEPKPLPCSGFLDVLGERPYMFLPATSVRCLRAFLDGYGLAAAEDDCLECLDLEGFEHWVRKRLDIKGSFRWEDAILANFDGREPEAYGWAIRELKEFRSTKGPLTDRRYEVIRFENTSDRSE
jgi:hypothetical protein